VAGPGLEGGQVAVLRLSTCVAVAAYSSMGVGTSLK
jgi:hypothetical protein